MSQFRLEISGDDIKAIVPRLRQALERTTQLAALELQGNIAEEAPVDHGHLSDPVNWQIIRRGFARYIVGTHIVYAKVQNDGRGPFIIRPNPERGKKALHFFVNGQEVFCKYARHPGIKGKHYVEKSIDKTESRLDDLIYWALKEGGLVE